VLVGAVQGAPGSRALLAAGDLGRVRAGGVASVEHGVDVERYLGWMQHRLVYSLVPAQEIARDLERWYDLTITLEPRLRSIRVTTTLDPAGSADDAVRRLATLLNAQYERTGTQVRVYRHAPAAPAPAPTPRDSVERT
jgi:ferric-dicitrate binding protein FerR (iron transport regulator)